MNGSLAIPEHLRFRYQPVSLLGEGGMGRVVRAWDRLLQKEVALKLVRPDRRPEESRLREEYAVLSALHHPGIVRVHALGLAEGTVYLASDCIEGEPLSAYLDRETSKSEGLSVIANILRTLGWLHDQGVVHGDLKPGNILVVERGNRPWPILIDFGLAQDAEGGRLLGGTPAYMAPELLQSNRNAPTPSSDLFALGRCLDSWVIAESDVRDWVRVLLSSNAADRPNSAWEALSALPHMTKSSGYGAQVGGRGVAAFWGNGIAPIAEAVARGEEVAIELHASDDATPFLQTLKMYLDLAEIPSILLPEESFDDEPLSLWWRLIPCLVGGGLDVDSVELMLARPTLQENPSPDEQKTALMQVASSVISILRRVESTPVLLLPNPLYLSQPDRYVLTRVLDADVNLQVVLAEEWSDEDESETPWRNNLTAISLPAPARDEVMRLLQSYGILCAPSDLILNLLTSRAAAGASALRALLDAWVQAGVLVSDGEWRWSDTVDPLQVEGDGVASLWERLWDHLPLSAQMLVRHTLAMGGRGTIEELLDLRRLVTNGPSEALEEDLVRLSGEGWTTAGADGVVLLHPAPARWSTEQVICSELSHSERNACLEILEEKGWRDRPALGRMVASHYVGLGQHQDAADAWIQVSRKAEEAFDLAGAARAWLEAARLGSEHLSDRPEDVSPWFDCVERAARAATAAGIAEAADAAIALAGELAEKREDRGTSIRHQLLRAVVGVHLNRADEAMDGASKAERLLEEGVDDLDPHWVKMEALLGRGAALVQRGDSLNASGVLEEAHAEAELVGDLHAIGRITNNLGTVWFQQAEWEKAAAAYNRSAEAKAEAGDQRGVRIAQSNAALVLQRMGALSEALQAASKARSVAEQMGDRRGSAMGTLALADLWLNLGDIQRSGDELAAFAALPSVSPYVSIEGDLVEARRCLVAGSARRAVGMCRAVYEQANALGIAPVAKEAWCLSYVARILSDDLQGDEDVQPSQDEKVLDAYLSDVMEKSTTEADAVVLSALVHGWARSGEWGRARKGLSTCKEALSQGVPVGGEYAVFLMARAAELLADEEMTLWAHETGEGIVVARMAQWDEVPENKEEGAVRPSFRQLASALLLDESRPRSVHTGIREVGMDFSADSWLSIVDELGGLDSIMDLERWPEVITKALGASHCMMYAFEDSGPNMIAQEGGPAASTGRWREVLSRLSRGGGVFEAGASEGGIEALGVPIEVKEDSRLPLGAVILEWRGGDAGDATQAREWLLRNDGILVLAFEHRALRRSNSYLRTELQRVMERVTRTVAAHEAEVSALRESLHHSQTESELRHRYDRIVHKSDGMRRTLRTLDKVIDTDLAVLLLGESGVGKEVLARALHFNGSRQSAPFVSENCGAIPPDLFESVFFGSVKGAFTGAIAERIGLLETAHGGTLFLDEIGELRPDHQVKLLRVIQERTFRPVGSTQEIEVDFRLVCATNSNLKEAVKAGTFREDLYYRIAVLEVDIPPLRERVADIVPLALHFLDMEKERSGRTIQLTPSAAELLQSYTWPGNVRQLQNEILRASALCTGDQIHGRHLSSNLRDEMGGAGIALGGMKWDGNTSLSEMVDVLEREVIAAALERSRGKKAGAARMLGISRPGLDAKIKRLEIAVVRDAALSHR